MHPTDRCHAASGQGRRGILGTRGDTIHYQDANNRTDSPLRFVVTMIMAPGQPMLVFVEDEELKQSGWVRRSPD